MRVGSTYKLFFTSKEELERRKHIENEARVLRLLGSAFKRGELCATEILFQPNGESIRDLEDGLKGFKDELSVKITKVSEVDVSYTQYFICYNKI